MSIEKTLAAIKSKADFKAWVDELPDDAIGVVLITYNSDNGEREHVKFREIGDITVEQSFYLAATWQWYLMGCMHA